VDAGGAVSALAITLGALAVVAQAAPPPYDPSWPCWRGADGTNVSAETGWTTEGAEEPLFRVAVGRGHSSVAVAGGRLYTQGFDEAQGRDRYVCLDARTGAELWSHAVPAELDANSHGGGTHGTPAVHDGVVYAFERQGVLRAFDAGTGAPRWTRDLVADHGVKATDYGFGSSPLVAGELVVVNAQRVIAVERTTGETRWLTDDLGAYYSTPALCNVRGRAAVASFDRPGLDLVDLATGERFGHFPFVKGQTSVSASTPVVVDASRLFISSGYGHGAALVDVSGAEPVAIFETRAMRTQLSGCTLVGGHLYGFDETILKCLDLDGKERWRTRGHGMGALTASDGRLIVLSASGELVIVAAQPEKYVELAKRDVLDGGSFWATPVLCGGVIYLRSGEGELVALDHRASAAR
jgi:outer membrane protein assembly factor BamB